MLATPSTSDSHERIGRYEVLRKIATGGMAELFLAKQVGMEGFERVVAIKRILAHLAYDEEFINMFRDEARIVAKLSHPNIVQIYDLGKSDDSYFIAMEYIPGRNMSSVAKKARAKGERLPPAYIARCVAQACEGLHYAHTRADMSGKPMEIVHRDVSPQNIIVSFSGTVKLVDFGIAKAATKIAHTRAGVLKGKYAYMSPEQIRGEEVDARSDLFAAGIVLYELLCGRRPFEKDNSIQTLKSIVQEPHRDCRELNDDIPDTLADIIDRALEKDRSRRFQSAQALQIALEDFVSAADTRVNNLTVANWVKGLFEEELSKEQGGTMVLKGIGEVVLPEAREDEPPTKSPEAAPPSGDGDRAQSVATSSADSSDAEPIRLSRGRGGGSVDVRPPIPAPSNALVQGGEGEARESLIEEGVIERPVERREGGYDDDATVMGVDGPPAPRSRASTEVPEAYDDGRTEFAAPSSDQDNTLVPDEGLKRPEPPAPEPVAAPRPDSGEFLQPLAADDDFDDGDDPWDEATVGYPDGQAPDAVLAAQAEAEAEAELPKGWGELSSEFDADPSGSLEAFAQDQDATLAGPPEAWDDETANNRAYPIEDEALDPVVGSPMEFEDSEPLDLDLGPDPEDDDEPIPGDATITQPSLEELGHDATIAVPSISDEIIERHTAHQHRLGQTKPETTRGGADDRADDAVGFEDDSTLGAAHIELSGSDVEPLDFGEPTGDSQPAFSAEPPSWSADATVAGAPSLPDVAGLDPDEDFDVDDGASEVPGLEVEVDYTVRAMDEEPALPVPRSDRDVDQDARTVAGTTSDYLSAGVAPGASGPYDEEPAADPEPAPEYRAPSPKKRGQEALGAIRLQRMERGQGAGTFSSEEVTEGEVPAHPVAPEVEIPGVMEDASFEVSLDDDAPPVQPSPLEEPPDEAEPASAASARDEYSALLAPKLPAPINSASETPPSGEGGAPIGSTNVPPANLSLSAVLSHPSRASRSKLMPIPRGGSEAGGRSASVIGRQIREVVRDRGPSVAPPTVTPASLDQPTAPMPPQGPAQGRAAPPPAALEMPGPPPPTSSSGGGRRRGLLVVLVILATVLLAGVAYVAVPLLFPKSPRLMIITNPSGAKVYVDNTEQSQTTPLTISGLTPGVKYAIRLVRDGYEPVSQTVRLPKDRPLIWRIPLVPDGKSAAPPGAAPPAPKPAPAAEP